MENIPETQVTPAVKEKKSWKTRVKAVLDKVPKDSKRKILRLVVVIAVILLLTNPALIPFLPSSVKATLVGALTSLFGNVSDISSVVPLNWIVLFKLVVMVLMVMIIKEVGFLLLNNLKPKTGRGRTVLTIVQSGFNYLIVCFGIFWGLSVLGVDLSTLFASLGILALIIGFGAESLIADLVTGLFMIFENEYNVGDIIEIDGYRGTVTEIGIRTTSVTDSGGNVKVFNNSEVRNIVNLSSRGSTAVCDFCIPYEVKIADAEKAINQVLAEIQAQYPEIFIQTPELLGVQTLGESSVTLRVVAPVAESDRFKAARLMNRGLKDGMERLGISCPYNQLVVHKAD